VSYRQSPIFFIDKCVIDYESSVNVDEQKFIIMIFKMFSDENILTRKAAVIKIMAFPEQQANHGTFLSILLTTAFSSALR
jgi:hypothetical protein